MNVNVDLGLVPMDDCCALLEGSIDQDAAEDLAKVLAALADPTRLRIVSMLADSPDGSGCGCELEGPLGLAQPTISHHLKVLREAGVVVGERRGRWVHYRIVEERLGQISEALSPRVSV